MADGNAAHQDEVGQNAPYDARAVDAARGTKTPDADGAKSPAGRPSSFDRVRGEIIVKAVRGGASIHGAASCGGVDGATVRRWMIRGEAEESGGQYRDFRDAMVRARGEVELERVKAIGICIDDDWRAAAWLLERRDPLRWGKSERGNGTTTNVAVKIDAQAAQLTDDDLRNRILAAVLSDPVLAAQVSEKLNGTRTIDVNASAGVSPTVELPAGDDE